MRHAAVLMLLWAGSLHAHEIGTSRVSVVFHDGRTFDVELVTDATALAEKLEAVSGLQLPAGLDARGLQGLLTDFDQSFRQRVTLAFDGVAIRPDITYVVVPPMDATSAAAATIHLTGLLPTGSRTFTWTFGWTFATYAMTANTATQWLEGNQPSAPVPVTSEVPAASRFSTAWRYLRLGFTHIMPNGFDHILFVLGIYLLSRRTRSVLLQVSAFTLAHSITLGLSLYGIVSVSPRIVEPMIALSIAYVAIENIFLSELKSWRIALVFTFGLLHGMGFAGALKELGLPRSEFVLALVTFNIGVEFAQLIVIGAAFLLVGWYCADRAWYRSRVVVPASAMIACTAAYWTITRLSL